MKTIEEVIKHINGITFDDKYDLRDNIEHCIRLAFEGYGCEGINEVILLEYPYDEYKWHASVICKDTATVLIKERRNAIGSITLIATKNKV